MQDDDDEVLQEIPVFSTKNLAGKLFVYQYPNEIGDLESTPVISSSIKLSNREVKLEVSLDTDSNNYDSHKGERIGKDANGEPPSDPKKPHEKYFRRDIMDRIKIESRQAVPEVSNFVAGILHNNELHITPLKAIIDLRKSLSYLDQADKQAKTLAKEQGLLENSGDEEEEEAKQVTVKFARQDNDRYKQAKERSFRFLTKKNAEEPWHHTEFHGCDTKVAQSERQRLYSSKQASCLMESSPGPRATIEQQVALLNLGNSDMGPQGDDPLAIEDFKRLPLQDRVKSLIAEVKLIQFSRLLNLLSLESDAVNALRVVQQVGVLVRGNWAARSDIVYKKDNVKPVVGEVPPHLMCHGRDYILYLFTQQRYVDRLKVAEAVKIPADIVRDILCQIARVTPNRTWELILPPDEEFIAKYPEVVQRQQLQWDMKQKQLKEAFKDGPPSPTKTRRKSNRDSSVSDSDAMVEGVPKRKHRRKSQSVGLSSDNESGTEAGTRQRKNSTAKSVGKKAIKAEPKDS